VSLSVWGRVARERGLRTGRAHCRGEGADVISAEVAPVVDEERRGAGYAAQVGAVDVLGDAGGAGVPGQVVGEAIDVEAQAVLPENPRRGRVVRSPFVLI
jgi:hypothetical protein